MKKAKTILFSVAVVCVSLFLCSAGCQNVAGGGGASSSGGQQGGGGVHITGNEATVIPVIEQLTDSSPVLTVTLTDEVTGLSNELKTAIKNVPDGKINLDLSQTKIGIIDITEFQNCTSLTSVAIPNSVTEIKAGAFMGCTSLTGVTIPSGVTEIRGNAFSGCTSLRRVTIPDSVTKIGSTSGDGAFQGCTALTAVTILSSVTIGSNTFKGCTSLTSLTIPSNVRAIYYGAFEDCSSLTSMTVKATNPPSLSSDMFSTCASNLKIYVPSEKLIRTRVIAKKLSLVILRSAG